MTELRIKTPRLESFIARAFEAVEVPPADAKIVAQLMSRADVNGSEGHGIFRLPGVERIWLPGEQSHAKRVERSKNGVPVPPALLASLNQLADELGMKRLA